MPHAPSVGDFPVVLFELEIVLCEIDADGFEAAQILIDHVVGRRLQDHLQLLVLVQAIGIFAVTAVGGTAAGLHVRDAIWLGPEHAQKRFGAHGARADFHVVRLLNDGSRGRPSSASA